MRVYQFRHIRADDQCSRTITLVSVAIWRFLKRVVRETILFYTAKRD